VANPPPPPYVSQLNLQVHPASSPWARRHTRDVLTAWSIEGDPMDAVELAVSELVTNAIKHIQDAPELSTSPEHVRLSLRHMRTHVLIEVADGRLNPPVVATDVPWDTEGGRGLSIVTSICKQWGCYWPLSGGKVVWCEISL
jgi:anti-sigma regulatory factor (Ser/Thr protein kinase)